MPTMRGGWSRCTPTGRLDRLAGPSRQSRSGPCRHGRRCGARAGLMTAAIGPPQSSRRSVRRAHPPTAATRERSRRRGGARDEARSGHRCSLGTQGQRRGTAQLAALAAGRACDGAARPSDESPVTPTSNRLTGKLDAPASPASLAVVHSGSRRRVSRRMRRAIVSSRCPVRAGSSRCADAGRRPREEMAAIEDAYHRPNAIRRSRHASGRWRVIIRQPPRRGIIEDPDQRECGGGRSRSDV